MLITGGASGIGYALAAAMKRDGAHVLICGRDPERLAEAADRLGVHAARCDVGDPGQLPALLEAVDEALGGLDVVVQNAGIQRKCELARESPEEVLDGSLRRELEVNLAGPVELTALAAPRLLEAAADQGAALVFVTSALALAPKASAPVYSASKAGLRSFAKAMRHQLGPRGVHVLEVVPPVVDTAMTAGREEAKMAPDAVAREILRALSAERDEVRIGKSRLLFWLHRLAPGLAERALGGQ